MTLTSHFFHPEIEMEKHEPLARASAFAVVATTAVSDPARKPSLHFFSVAHAATPHHYSHYYGDAFPFLNILADEDLKQTLEVRDQAGEIVSRFPVQPRLFRHPQRDLVIFHLLPEDEEAFVDLAMSPAVGIAPCVLYTPFLEGGTSLRFHGHLSTSELLVSGGDEGEKEAPMKPEVVNGFFLGSNGSAESGSASIRLFAKTDKPLVTGMCGGPVEVLAAEREQNKSYQVDTEGIVAGMVEGIVAKGSLTQQSGSEEDSNDPNTAARRKASQLLEEAAVIIPSAELWSFLKHVEKELR